MDERTKLCVQLASECAEILDGKLKEIGQILESDMETSHFFNVLDNIMKIHVLSYQAKKFIKEKISRDKPTVDKSMFWPTDDDDRYSPHPLDNNFNEG
jgi:hypothetical protein